MRSEAIIKDRSMVRCILFLNEKKKTTQNPVLLWNVVLTYIKLISPISN